MVENIIHIKSGITINVGAIVKMKKNIVCAKKITFGIRLHVVAKMVNIYLQDIDFRELNKKKFCESIIRKIIRTFIFAN